MLQSNIFRDFHLIPYRLIKRQIQNEGEGASFASVIFMYHPETGTLSSGRILHEEEIGGGVLIYKDTSDLGR